MELLPLTEKNRAIFEDYLSRRPHALSSYTFVNTLIWRTLFDLHWTIINDHLCLFFKNKVGMFMNLPPLGGLDRTTVKRCFEIMEDFNHNKDVSRIENVEEEDLDFFKGINLRTYLKGQEYVVSQRDISTLSGERFKHKRSLYNFFVKNYNFSFRDYAKEDYQRVLFLYRDWMSERSSKNSDPIYQAMLKDSLEVFARILEGAEELEIRASVVECAGRIRGFTCGFPITPRMFCINFEVADLSFKGIAQFLFSEFTKMLDVYPEINIMDDSGIDNIRQTKLSYRPLRCAPSYTARLAS